MSNSQAEKICHAVRMFLCVAYGKEYNRQTWFQHMKQLQHKIWISSFWDTSLRQRAIQFQSYEATYCPHLQGSKCPRIFWPLKTMIVPKIKHRHPITTNAASDSRIKGFSATTPAKTSKLANSKFGFLSLICKLPLTRRSTFQCVTSRNC
jgi:hypothetical protein